MVGQQDALTKVIILSLYALETGRPDICVCEFLRKKKRCHPKFGSILSHFPHKFDPIAKQIAC